MAALILDYDGTLHDTKALYGAAVRAACEQLRQEGFAPPPCTDEDAAKYLGVSPPDMWDAFLPGLPEERKTRCIAFVGEEMNRGIAAGKAKLYPGAEEALTQLKAAGHSLVFLSNCTADYMQAHFARFGLGRWFDGRYCSGDYGFAPKPDIFAHIRRDFAGPYIVIGDRASDLATAERWGLKSIGCAYGFGTEEELKTADAVARDVRELPGLVEALLQG